MRRVGLLLMVVCGLTGLYVRPGALPCRVRMLNGNFLNGFFAGQEGALFVFDCPWQSAPIRIHGKYIDQIDFGRKPLPRQAGARLFYLDGTQWFRGTLRGQEQGALSVEPPWGGRMQVEAGYLQRIETAPPVDAVMYRGPVNFKDWRFSIEASYPLQQEVMENNWLLPPGESTLTLPWVEGSFVLRMVLRLPAVRGDNQLGFTLRGFPRSSREDLRRERLLSFTLRGDAVQINWQGQVFVRQRRWAGGGAEVTSLPLPPGREMVLTLTYNEPDNRVSIDINGKGLQVLPEEGWQNDQGSSRPVLSFFVRREDVRPWLQELWVSRHPGVAEETEPGDGERVRFQNGDVLKARWQGLDGDGRWILSAEGLPEGTVMGNERIYAWHAAAAQIRTPRRKAADVRVYTAGGSGSLLAEFVGADTDGIRFRREGVSGEFTIPFTLIERLMFNPYFD